MMARYTRAEADRRTWALQAMGEALATSGGDPGHAFWVAAAAMGLPTATLRGISNAARSASSP